eukprot:COSAG01_NODE_2857_length_6960_cov_44.361901_12_plen_186_part_00
MAGGLAQLLFWVHGGWVQRMRPFTGLPATFLVACRRTASRRLPRRPVAAAARAACLAGRARRRRRRARSRGYAVPRAPPGDRNRIRWLAVVRTHLGHLSDPAEIVGFGCTRIAAGRQAEIYWDLRRKWPQICRNSAEPAEKTYAHTHLGHPCTTANQRIRLRSPCAQGSQRASTSRAPNSTDLHS